MRSRRHLLALSLLPVFLWNISTAMAIDDPTDISSLRLWLDASQGVTTDGSTPATNTDLVHTWHDQSGQDNDALQTTGSVKPSYRTNVFNGMPAIRFATDDRLVTDAFLSALYNTAFTIFIVGNKDNNDFEASTSNQGQVWLSARNDHLVHYTTNLSVQQTFLEGANTNLGVEAFMYSGSLVRLRFNGAGGAALATGNLGLTGALTIGKISNSENYHYDGDIAEIIVYNRVLTNTETEDVEAYLTDKYDLTPGNLIIFDGDSLTRGLGATDGFTYPEQVLETLEDDGLWLGYNAGVSAQTMADILSDAVRTVDVNYNADLPYNIVSLFGGTNDLYYDDDAGVVYNRIVTYAQARRAAGFQVIVHTLLPRSDDGVADDFEVSRQIVNANIRENWRDFADALSDVASDPRIGDDNDELNTTYYSVDHVHLKDAGYAIVAEYVADAVSEIVKTDTTTILASSSNPVSAGASVTLTATVSPSSVTGSVLFKEQGVTLGTATLGHGSGSIATSALSVGTHLLTAIYMGNATHTGSISPSLLQTVSPTGTTVQQTSGGGGARRSTGNNTPTYQSDQSARVQAMTALQRLLTGVRDRLAARINKRIAEHPEIAPFLQQVLARLDERLQKWLTEE